MLQINRSNALRVVVTNYLLIVVEGGIGAVLALNYNIFHLQTLVYVFFILLIVNLIIHLILVLIKGQAIIDASFMVLAIVTLLAIAVLLHYQPSVRSATILAFIPTLIFTAALGLNFGVIGLLMVVFTTIGLLVFDLYFPSGEALTMSGQFVTGAFIFSFTMVVILGIIANYFMEIFRRKENDADKLSEENKQLYQQTRTTADKIIENINEGLVVLDRSLNVIKYNATFNKLIKGRVIVGRPLSKNQSHLVKAMLGYISSNNQERLNIADYTYKTKYGNTYKIKISGMRLSADNYGYIVLVEKRPVPWGKVFDSDSKKPIQMAIVRLFNSEREKLVSTEITGVDGQFGFIVPPGKYYISVQKRGWEFPSRKSKKDYRGEEFKISSVEGSFVKFMIPLDKVKAYVSQLENDPGLTSDIKKRGL